MGKKVAKIEKTCEWCGSVFFVCPSSRDQKYCGKKCGYRGLGRSMKGEGHSRWVQRVNGVCKWCGLSFEYLLTDRKRIFCSTKCFVSYRESRRSVLSCPVCASVFTITPSEEDGRRKFCSKKCSDIFHGVRPPVQKKCKNCNKEFTVSAFEKARVHCPKCVKEFGSLLRQSERIEKVCIVCGKKFIVAVYNRYIKHCSHECGSITQRKKISGSNCYMWKGGITPELTHIRESLGYKNWRKSVFERDDYTCQFCGRKDKGLNAHHIKRFVDYPTLRLDVDNGLTLCEECHINIHRAGKVIQPDKVLSIVSEVN